MTTLVFLIRKNVVISKQGTKYGFPPCSFFNAVKMAKHAGKSSKFICCEHARVLGTPECNVQNFKKLKEIAIECMLACWVKGQNCQNTHLLKNSLRALEVMCVSIKKREFFSRTFI